MKKIFADFNNADTKGRLRLSTVGSLESIKSQGIELYDGLKVMIDDDESLRTLGTVYFSHEENRWVAQIDWNNIEHY
jgi:hypothetical protein